MGLSKEQLNLIHTKEPIDYEIYELIYLINKVEGITTTSSCFGHNTKPIRIYCVADSIECLNKFMYDYFYCNSLISFKMLISDKTIDAKNWSKIEFVIESDPHYIAYPCTQLIADNLTRTFREKLSKEAFVEAYNRFIKEAEE